MQNLKQHLMSSYQAASYQTNKAKLKQKRTYDKKCCNTLRLGDRVLVQNKQRDSKVKGTQKLANRWEAEPYIVILKHNNLPVYTARCLTNDKERTLHRNRLTLCMFPPVEIDVEKMSPRQVKIEATSKATFHENKPEVDTTSKQHF